MTIDNFISNSIKRPVQVGKVVMVYNGNNKLVKIYSTLELGKAYFSKSNDSFYKTYGFNFVPSGAYWQMSKAAAGKM